VKTDGEELQKSVIVRAVARLQRIDDDRDAVRLQHPRDLGRHDPAHLGRQLVEEIDAGDGILRGVGNRHRLRIGFDERRRAALREPCPRLADIGGREIEPGDVETRPVLLHLFEKAACAASDVEEMQAALVAPRKGLRQRHQRLTAHRIRRAAEQHLDLRIVELGGFFREPAARLIVKILEIVARIFPTQLWRQNLGMLARQAPLIDLARIAKETKARCDGLRRREQSFRRAVEPRLDILPIPLEKRAHARDETLPARHLALDRNGFFSRRHQRPAHTMDRKIMPDIPGDPRALLDAIAYPRQGACHPVISS